jgi:hypothetical protein
VKACEERGGTEGMKRGYKSQQRTTDHEGGDPTGLQVRGVVKGQLRIRDTPHSRRGQNAHGVYLGKWQDNADTKRTKSEPKARISEEGREVGRTMQQRG